MPFAHAKRDGHRLVEEVAAGHGDEEVEDAVAAQHGLRPQPLARDVEDDFAAADEDDTAVGDDHAGGEVDVIADEGNLPFPDDAVRLQRAPDGASGTADGRNVVAATGAVRPHASACQLPSTLMRPPSSRDHPSEAAETRSKRGGRRRPACAARTPCTYSLP